MRILQPCNVICNQSTKYYQVHGSASFKKNHKCRKAKKALETPPTWFKNNPNLILSR